MRGLERSWDTSFDPSEVGKQAMFVWCPTKDDAEELVESCYLGADRAGWIRNWNSCEAETVYVIPKDGGSSWMYGDRDSLSDYYAERGYVPRVFRGLSSNAVEVGDLL